LGEKTKAEKLRKRLPFETGKLIDNVEETFPWQLNPESF